MKEQKDAIIIGIVVAAVCIVLLLLTLMLVDMIAKANTHPLTCLAYISTPYNEKISGHLTYYRVLNDQQTQIGIDGVLYTIHPSNIILIDPSL